MEAIDVNDFESALPTGAREMFSAARKRVELKKAAAGGEVAYRRQREEQADADMMNGLRDSCVRGTKWMLGDRFAEKTFENFDVNPKNREALEVCRKFAAEFGPGRKGLLLMGPNGIGKNHLAAAVVNELAKRIYYSYFSNIVSVKNKLMDAIGYGVEGAIGKLLSYDMICINDLGAERAPKTPGEVDYTQEILFGLIDGAYEDNKTLIITTNMSDAELFERYGKRIVSRLIGMCDVVEYEDFDHRVG